MAIPPPDPRNEVNGNPVLTFSDPAGRLWQPSRNRPSRVAAQPRGGASALAAGQSQSLSRRLQAKPAR